MLTFRQGMFMLLTRGAAAALLTTILTACGGSMTPATAPSLVAPSDRGGSPAVAFKYLTLDNAKDPTFNQLLGISRARTIVGYYGSGMPGHPNKGYLLHPPFQQDDYERENFPRSAQSQVTAINNLNDTAGFWIDKKMVNRGFLHWKGHFSSYSAKGSSFTQLLGVNNKGLAVGFYTIGTKTYGFELDRKTGRSHPLGPHGGVGATPTSINNDGAFCGFFTSGGKTIGFMIVGKKYTGIHYPGAMTTQPFGINDKLDVVGDYVDKAGKMHGFLVQTPATHPVWTSFDDPNGVGTTTINGLNDRLDMVGFYVDSKGNTHGMLIIRP